MSKHEDIYLSLRKRLAEGEFKVGDLFLSIAEVAQAYSVSSVTAERPLRRLHDEGWILVRQGHRNQVRALPPEEQLDVLAELYLVRSAVTRLIEHLETSAGASRGR